MDKHYIYNISHSLPLQISSQKKMNQTSNESFGGIFSHQRPHTKRMREKYPGTISQKSLTHSAVLRISTNLFIQKLHILRARIQYRIEIETKSKYETVKILKFKPEGDRR